jgi:hypothetical protein
MSFALALSIASCGDDPETCSVGSREGCEEGFVCEAVAGGEPTCFTPIQLRGRIFDAASGAGIEGATIVALDASAAPRSVVARSAVDGTYVLPVAVERAEDGAFNSESVFLRVDADGYQTFPTAPRTALPIEVSEGELMDVEGARVIMNTTTDVALIGFSTGSGGGRIEGVVDHPDGGGVLVVAEQGGTAVSTAISDRDGAFILFNVPAAATEVKGFRANLNVSPVSLTTSGAVDLVTLTATTEGLASVSGNINFADAGGVAQLTTVILVVDSTFDPEAVRGEAPAGLRADMVSGAYTITGVPPGRYAVLASFENDDLVRDPDEGIGGTEVVRIDVAGANVDLEVFKVTAALAVVGPGADTIETIAGDPTFEWADDSSEDGYELRVFDSFGDIVHEDLMVPSVSGAATVTYTWSGATLEPGMIYQFRAWSYRERTPPRTYISATEDLRGVFRVE